MNAHGWRWATTSILAALLLGAVLVCGLGWEISVVGDIATRIWRALCNGSLGDLARAVLLP